MRAGVLLHTIEEKPVSRILPHGFHMVLNSHGSETIWSTHVVFSDHISNTSWVVCGFEQPWLPLYLMQKNIASHGHGSKVVVFDGGSALAGSV